jgi:ABC-type amino acid transport substrate-binding protein
MQRALIFLNLTLIAAGACACGDKMMLVMGARSSRIKPIRPAMILAYPGQNASATVIRDLQRQLAAKKARHRLQVVEDHAALDSALRAGKYDLVIADVANANELSERLLLAPSKPIVLPVAFQASKAEQAAAQKKYHCLLKAPGDPDNYLEAIDQAMEWKLKTINR